MSEGRPADRVRIDDKDYVRKILILAGVVVLVLLAWQLSGVLLLAFGSILVAIILHAFADVLVRYCRIPPRVSLPLASLIILGFLLGVILLFGANLRTQMAGVAQRLPEALDAFGKNVGLGPVSDDLTKLLSDVPGSGLALRIAGIGGTIIGGLTDFILVVIAGLYIAASPQVYVKGVVKLFPVGQHRRVESSLAASGEALRLWLISQLMAMICVGVLATLAYWLIGLPSPYALGLIAGSVEFIPFLGPILGALPAVLISFTLGIDTVIWTLVAVTAIQQLEGNLIFPLIEKRMVSIPPALALFGIVVGGVLFGTVGLMLGFPLVVVVYVLVKKLYVRETLGESTPVPGEDKAGGNKPGGPPGKARPEQIGTGG